MRKKQVRVTTPMAARMRALTEAGLSREAVATVIELDFGSRPSSTTVKRYAGKSAGQVGMGK